LKNGAKDYCQINKYFNFIVDKNNEIKDKEQKKNIKEYFYFNNLFSFILG
jgi:hypothetical protein